MFAASTTDSAATNAASAAAGERALAAAAASAAAATAVVLDETLSLNAALSLHASTLIASCADATAAACAVLSAAGGAAGRDAAKARLLASVRTGPVGTLLPLVATLLVALPARCFLAVRLMPGMVRICADLSRLISIVPEAVACERAMCDAEVAAVGPRECVTGLLAARGLALEQARLGDAKGAPKSGTGAVAGGGVSSPSLRADAASAGGAAAEAPARARGEKPSVNAPVLDALRAGRMSEAEALTAIASRAGPHHPGGFDGSVWACCGVADPERYACSIGPLRQSGDGLEAGARVMRGPHWNWQSQDGGVGGFGVVLSRTSWSGSDRQGAKVEWANGHSNTYRWGFEGKFDLTIVAEALGDQSIHRAPARPSAQFGGARGQKRRRSNMLPGSVIARNAPLFLCPEPPPNAPALGDAFAPLGLLVAPPSFVNVVLMSSVASMVSSAVAGAGAHPLYAPRPISCPAFAAAGLRFFGRAESLVPTVFWSAAGTDVDGVQSAPQAALGTSAAAAGDRGGDVARHAATSQAALALGRNNFGAGFSRWNGIHWLVDLRQVTIRISAVQFFPRPPVSSIWSLTPQLVAPCSECCGGCNAAYDWHGIGVHGGCG